MATKRKVSNILDTLSEDTDSSGLSLAKRPKRVISKFSSLSKRDTSSNQFNQRRRDSNPDQPPENSTYAPWSRDLFLKRLSTFQYRNWSIPYELKQISALECCKHGWEALDVSESAKQNTIQCVHCTAILNVNVGSDPNIQQKMAAKFAEMLISQHKDSCPWKSRGSDDAVYVLPLTNSQKREFFTRYEGLISHKPQIDKYAYNCTPELTDSAFEKLPIEDQSSNRKEAKLALLGWKFDSKVGSTCIISCGLCFRKVVLNHDLDLVKEHMSYCPYIQRREGRLQWVNLYDLVKHHEATETHFIKADARSNDEETRKTRLAKLKRIYFG